MQQVIEFLSEIELLVYFVLGFIGVLYLRKLFMAINEHRSSVFGLEKEAAQRKVVAATTVLILIGLLLVTEFIASTFLAVELPQQPSYATPTIEVLVTPTTTLPGPIPTDATMTATSYPQAVVDGEISNCIVEVLEFTYPVQDDKVSGVVELQGTVNVPNFGSYKYEYSALGEINWVTVAAGSELRIGENLGYWYTISLVPGDYLLKLVALDNDGVELTPCIIKVEVVPTEN